MAKSLFLNSHKNSEKQVKKQKINQGYFVLQNFQLNKMNFLSSNNVASQKKCDDSIILASNLSKKSLQPAQVTPSQIIIQKQKQNKLPSVLPTSDFQILNSSQFQLDQITRNMGDSTSKNVVAPRPMISNQIKAQQSIQKETKIKFSITLASNSSNLSKQIPPKNNITQLITSKDQIVDIKNQKISTYQLTRPSSSQSSLTSLTEKQNYEVLKTTNSAKSTISNRKLPNMKNKLVPQPSQQIRKQESSIIPKNELSSLLIQENEEDFYQKQEEDKIEQVEQSICLNNVKIVKDISNIKQLESSFRNLTVPFFELMNNTLTLKIVQFLSVEDLIMLATISRKARNLVVNALKIFDYSDEVDDYYPNKFKEEYQVVNRISKIQKDFNSFLSKQDFQKKLLAFLETNLQNKFHILEILKAGMFYTHNSINPNLNVINNLKKKGILNCFSSINLPFYPSSNLKIAVPTFLPSKNSQLEQFIDVIYSYVELQRTNKVPIQQQQKAAEQISLYEPKIKFMKNKDKLLSRYMKPIERMKKNSQLFDYINKNSFQIIIQFLTIKEISIIFQTGKTMRQFVKEVAENYLTYLESQKESLLLSLELDPEFANGILYVKQFQQFEKEEQTYIMSRRFGFAPLCEQLKAICFAVTSKTQEEIDTQFQVDPTKMYKIKFNYTIPHPKRLQQINSFMETYPTLKEFKQKRLNYKNICKIDESECILLYQVMQGYQKLTQFRQNNEQNFKEACQNYTLIISPLDKIIFKYKRLLGKNENELFILPKLEQFKAPLAFEELDFLLFSN